MRGGAERQTVTERTRPSAGRGRAVRLEEKVRRDDLASPRLRFRHVFRQVAEQFDLVHLHAVVVEHVLFQLPRHVNGNREGVVGRHAGRSRCVLILIVGSAKRGVDRSTESDGIDRAVIALRGVAFRKELGVNRGDAVTLLLKRFVLRGVQPIGKLAKSIHVLSPVRLRLRRTAPSSGGTRRSST